MTKLRRQSVFLCGALCAAGCEGKASDLGLFESGTDGQDGGSQTGASHDGGSQDGGSADGESAEGGSAEGDSGADGGSAEDGGQKFDVGTGDDVPMDCDPDSGECHCNEVDILFVIDNSGSMNTHRAGINAAFDDLVDQMITVLPPGTDLNVGLTRGTGFFNPGNSGGWSSCDQYQTDGSWNPPDVMDNGSNGHQGRLFTHDGRRFFAMNTDHDPTDLRTWFQGALQGTINGFVNFSNSETVVAGAAYPFHPVNDTANDGFVRDHAVLVLFLLSDSPDLSPPNVSTQSMIDMVSAKKAPCGDHCIITAGAIAGACYNEAPTYQNNRLYEFMNGFGNPPASMIDLNAGTPDFAGVLGTALAEVIATTCDEIMPEG